MRGVIKKLLAMGINMNKNIQEKKYFVWEAGRLED
jgi:hypothetical protein